MRLPALLIAAALAAGSAAGPAAASVSVAVGVNSAIRNDVKVQTSADPAPRPAVLRGRVGLGDRIASGAASQLQVLLLDKSVFTVGSNARLTIDRFVFDPARGTGEVAASVARGAFRFMSGRALARGGGGAAAVTTPVASIGVRGTIVEGVVGPDALFTLEGEPGIPAGDAETATLIVLRGPGPRTDGLDKPGAIDVTGGGRTVSADRPGEAIFIAGPGQPPVGPFALSDAASARLSGLLRAAPTQAADSGEEPLGSASVASGEILSAADAGGSLAYDPLASDFPVRRSDDLGVPCDQPGGGGVCSPR